MFFFFFLWGTVIDARCPLKCLESVLFPLQPVSFYCSTMFVRGEPRFRGDHCSLQSFCVCLCVRSDCDSSGYTHGLHVELQRLSESL